MMKVIPCCAQRAAVGPVASVLVILLLVTSVFAVVSVRLFGTRDDIDFGKCARLHAQ